MSHGLPLYRVGYRSLTPDWDHTGQMNGVRTIRQAGVTRPQLPGVTENRGSCRTTLRRPAAAPGPPAGSSPGWPAQAGTSNTPGGHERQLSQPSHTHASGWSAPGRYATVAAASDATAQTGYTPSHTGDSTGHWRQTDRRASAHRQSRISTP